MAVVVQAVLEVISLMLSRLFKPGPPPKSVSLPTTSLHC